MRKYDEITGRFNSIDPLWAEQIGWNPYHYSANNPVNAVDLDGKRLFYVNEEDKINIINSVEKKYRGNIYFDNNEVKLKKYVESPKNSNYYKLRYLIKHIDKIVYSEKKSNDEGKSEVKVFSIVNGNTYTLDLNNTYGLPVNGITLISQKYKDNTSLKNLTFSLNQNHQIYTSNLLSNNLSGKKATPSEITAHELYGHLYLFLTNKPFKHSEDGVREELKKVENNTHD